MKLLKRQAYLQKTSFKPIGKKNTVVLLVNLLPQFALVLIKCAHNNTSATKANVFLCLLTCKILEATTLIFDSKHYAAGEGRKRPPLTVVPSSRGLSSDSLISECQTYLE